IVCPRTSQCYAQALRCHAFDIPHMFNRFTQVDHAYPCARNIMKNFLVAFILMALAATFGIGATPTKGLEVSAPGMRTLLMGAEDEFDLNQVRGKLIATGVLSHIDIHDVRKGLP